MLQKFFVFLISCIILMIAFIIIKIVVPMWRFWVVSDVVIELYAIFKECLKMEFSKKEIEIAYGKYCLKFTNVYEASLEFENLIHEAFEYYDNLGCIVNDTFKAQKNKLVRISSEVRTLKSKNLEDWRQCLQFLFNIFRVRS